MRQQPLAVSAECPSPEMHRWGRAASPAQSHSTTVQAGQAAFCKQAHERRQQMRPRLYGTKVKGTHGRLQMHCGSPEISQGSRG